MARLHFVVEGHAEEGFVNRVLRPEFGLRGIYADARRVLTGGHRGKASRGGLTNYEKLRNDIVLWMKEDSNQDSWFTTMVDYFRLPQNFPHKRECEKRVRIADRVLCLEAALATDIKTKLSAISDIRFIPHLQVYEFESLLFAGPDKFLKQFPAAVHAPVELQRISDEADGPENVDGEPDTHPSKRIRQVVAGYDKRSDGIQLALEIGLPVMRAKCPHFNAWICKLETLT